jgi:hypothetical protein
MPLAANTVRIFTLSADEWARPRTGEVIPEFEALRAVVGYWDKGTNFAVLIRYPGEDSGEIWASELRDWFIALGIPSDYILLLPGSRDADEISLIVGNRSELKL